MPNLKVNKSKFSRSAHYIVFIKEEKYSYIFSLVGHFQNETGHFWPKGMRLDGPALDYHKI